MHHQHTSEDIAHLNRFLHVKAIHTHFCGHAIVIVYRIRQFLPRIHHNNHNNNMLWLVLGGLQQFGAARHGVSLDKGRWIARNNVV